MSNLTDDDRKFGPLTIGPAGRGWRPLRVVLTSGGNGDDESTSNALVIYAFGWCASLRLPNILRPFKIKHMAESWDAATIVRLGRNFYFETFPREYGFSLSEGFLQIFYGARTHDSSTTQSWCKHLPWTQWRHVRYSLYDRQGQHFWTESKRVKGINSFADVMKAEEECPAVKFVFDDYDGKSIIATTRIEEREWHFGTGWFTWLRFFRKPKIRRSLDIKFSEEVGPEKGSWKGGTLGHGIDMLPTETHTSAFMRYCAMEHERKGRKYRLKFVTMLPFDPVVA